MTKRILLVDDRDYDRENTKRYLERYLVDEADGFLSAQGLVGKRPYDLVITDLRMDPARPFAEEGIEFTQYLREQGYSGPILLQTSCLSREIQESALEAGATMAIDKKDLSDRIIKTLLEPRG